LAKKKETRFEEEGKGLGESAPDVNPSKHSQTQTRSQAPRKLTFLQQLPQLLLYLQPLP